MPRSIMKFYRNVELSADAIFANDVHFVTSVSENVRHGTIGDVNNLRFVSMESELKNVIRSYALRGFYIEVTIVYIQFKSLKDSNLLGVDVNEFSNE